MTETTAPPPRSRRQRHERLTAWQACHALTLEIYRNTLTWSHETQEEGFAEDVRLSAMRATLHVQLGSSESTREGFLHELQVSLGKLARLSALLELARDVGELKPERYGELEAKRDHAEKLVTGLFAALRRERPPRVPGSGRGSKETQ